MALIYNSEARIELIEAASYYEACKSGLGQAFLAETESVIQQIVHHPLQWRKISGRFRRCLLKRFPYGIIYTVEEEGIFVAAFMHLRRKPGYWKKRTDESET